MQTRDGAITAFKIHHGISIITVSIKNAYFTVALYQRELNTWHVSGGTTVRRAHIALFGKEFTLMSDKSVSSSF